jgi:uncharacterized RDD family membrane protein YckC
MIVGIPRLGSGSTEASVWGGIRVCVHCGAKMDASQAGPLRAREFILDCLYVAVLIALVLAVGYLLHSWAEHGLDNFFHAWVWHEPLSDWDL